MEGDLPNRRVARLMAPPRDKSTTARGAVTPTVPIPPKRRRPSRRELAALFAGGCAGALVRTAVVRLGADDVTRWPWGTFAVNVGGCLLLGFLATRLQERLPLSPSPRPLLGTGFCGALTTFSTFELQLLRMLDQHRWWLALQYAAASVAAGLLGVALATVLARRVHPLS